MNMLFHTESGHILKGTPRDIHHDSLFFLTHKKCRVSRGDTGKLLIEQHDESIEKFSCRVIRTEDDGMVLKYYGARARAFFLPLCLNSTQCRNCGKTRLLEPCQSCNGIHALCSRCLARDTACKD